MRLRPVIDQRDDGVSKAVIAQDKDNQAFVSVLVKRIVESDSRTQLMDELCPKQGVGFTPIIERSKEIIKQQGNAELFERCGLSNKVHCEHLLNVCASRDTFSVVVAAQLSVPIQTPTVVEQMRREIRQTFELWTTPRVVSYQGSEQRSQIQHQNS